ncbi:hypothetical protein Q1695_006842 [Nippostrongylus brasiliensis]|nr:hypothetical protein Q1695_006842 [Nippostrongylus brasiliensis]
MFCLLVILQVYSSSPSDILYSLQGQDVLRRFHQYGLNNIYGIKSRLSRNQVAPFPLLHSLESNENDHLQATVNSSAEVAFSVPKRRVHNLINRTPIPIGKDATSAPRIAVSASNQITKVAHTDAPVTAPQFVEVRMVTRIAGGYPYGPRNFSIAVFPHALKVQRSPSNKLIFKTYSNATHDPMATNAVSDVYAVKHFDPPPGVCDANVSCRYCLAYWKLQKSFRPTNIFLFCCK